MARAIGIVRDGRVDLPHDAHFPDGARVIVEWDEASTVTAAPLEREAWTEEEVQKEIERAKLAR